jgi:hypothetical protein
VYEPKGEAAWMKAVATSMGIPVLFKGAMPTPTFFMPSAGTLAVAGCRGVQLGWLLVTFLLAVGGHEWGIAYMMPGATALTLMPLGACCFASARVKVTMAPLVDE